MQSNGTSRCTLYVILLYSIDTEYRFDTHDPDMQNAGASRPGIFA